jgi:hypothetical protein
MGTGQRILVTFLPRGIFVRLTAINIGLPERKAFKIFNA